MPSYDFLQFFFDTLTTLEWVSKVSIARYVFYGWFSYKSLVLLFGFCLFPQKSRSNFVFKGVSRSNFKIDVDNQVGYHSTGFYVY